MELRAFPVLYASDVTALAAFYTCLGFKPQSQISGPDGQVGFVGLRRDGSELGITTEQSPEILVGVSVGRGPRHEMFVYVESLQDSVDDAERGGARILRPPATMPWGERLAYLQDPEGNLVTLAQAA